MMTTLSGATRPALIVLATLALSACTTTMQPQSSVPAETAGGKPAAMKDGMSCACCGKMKKAEGKGRCCADMKEGCSCCSGMSGDGMMCAPKDKSGMDHSMMNHGGDIYAPAMKTMHEGMASVKQTGDADVDFVTGMIPHHQGAIDMAKIVLEKGKNPEIKKLAEGIVKAQESEIKRMNDWLASHKK